MQILNIHQVFLFSVIISVQINNNGTAASIAQKYTLTCDVTGANVTTYEWWKDNIVQNITEAAFSFPSLRVSDAGQYTCLVTVDEVVYNDTVNINITSKINTCNEISTLISSFYAPKFIVPAPISVTAESDLTHPILNIISTITLTCTIELSPAVDVPVNLRTTWTGPNGFMDVRTAHRMVTSPTYTSIVKVSPFGRNHSGNYTCVTTVSSTSNSPFIMDSLQSNSSKVEVTYGKR